jgi:predicted DNA-binding protein
VVVEAKYDSKPLQVVETPETKARIKAISDREKISQAAVVRDLIAMGLEERERRSEAAG